jgi:hypothetical protein
MKERRAVLTADQARTDAHADKRMILAKRNVPHGQEIEALGVALDALPRHVVQTSRLPLGVHGGAGGNSLVLQGNSG